MDAEEELGEELSPEERARRRRRLRVVLIVLVAVVLAIFVPPLVSLGRYRRSITASIAAALGRPVSAGGISLRLLPRPGIALSNFTVEEDPAFGYEPALHANTVVVSLRLSSLWRQRLEISRISLDQASLNLVKNSAGQWSIDSILLHAARIPNAPTAQRHAGPTPRFPYIEASHSRIDFKDGAEKKPFSLENAEFSMWQASAGEWRLRLKAQPDRTDLPMQIYDSGELNVTGSLRRAASLSAMPVNLRAEWSGAQLGQVSQLLAGFDSGWRGILDATGQIRGTPADLQLKSTVQIANLRRQEFQPLQTLDVDATCSGEYRHEQRALDNIVCFLPVSPGHLLLTGNVHGLAPAQTDLQLEINHVPAEFPITLLGLMRSSAQNVTAAGVIDGMFRLAATGQQRVLSGDATASGVSVTNSGGAWPLPTLHFVAARESLLRALVRRHALSAAQLPAILLEPAAIPFGESEPLTADGSLTRGGFTLHLAGPASLRRLTTPGATLGLLDPGLAAAGAKGRAELNVTTTGSWMPPLAGAASGISTSGTVHLAGAQLRPGFLSAPVEVESADIVIGPQQIAWRDAAIRYQGLAMRGSVEYPTVCDQPTPCPATFAVEAPALSGAAIEIVLKGRPRGFFGRIFGSRLSPWPPLEGTIRAKTFDLDRLPLRDAAATISLDGSGLTLHSVDAAALGGKVHATGAMTLSNGVPRWNLDVRMTGIKPAEAARVFHERWGAGRFDGEAKLTLTGLSTRDLEASAAGDFHFAWRNGMLMPAGPSPLHHFALWAASGTVVNRTLTLTGGGISRARRVLARNQPRVAAVRGSIAFDRHLDLTLAARTGPVHIRGTLAHPVATAH